MADADSLRRLVPADDRAVTVNDSIAAGAMIVIAVVLAGGLGIAVLTDSGETGPPQANFTFQYFGENGALIVTHSRGDAIRAGNLVLSNDEATATWATVAGTNNSTMIGSGDTIQLSARSAFGAAIESDDVVEVRWSTGNQTEVLATWRSGSG